MLMSLPDHLFIECREPLRAYRGFLNSNLDMPEHMSLDMSLEILIEGIRLPDPKDERLIEAAHDLAYDDSPVEEWSERVDEFYQAAFEAAVNLGGHIKQHLQVMGAYLHGELPYTFGTMLDAYTIVLSKNS